MKGEKHTMGFMKLDAIPEAKYLCDTIEDLNSLLPRPSYGDTCWIISEACEYIHNSKGEWLPKEKVSNTTTKVDLTGYATEDFVQEQIQNIQHPVVEVPSKLSELENDANYVQQAYVDNKVADLVNSAPETLDTIGEIAQALKDHQDVADAITEAIGKKANKEDLPSVEGLASEAFVTEAIQKIEFPVTDLSNYYTRDEVTQAIIDNAELPVTNDAYMQLVTDGEGNKIWEKKLAFSYIDTVPFLEEQVFTGEELMTPSTLVEAREGDRVTLYIDDIPYSGTLKESDMETSWKIEFDEGYDNPMLEKIELGKVNRGAYYGVPLGMVGKMSAEVTTEIITPIANKYLGVKIDNGVGIQTIVINGKPDKVRGQAAISLGGGATGGSYSVAAGHDASALGSNTFAASYGTAEGRYSAAFGLKTNAKANASLATGQYNIVDDNKKYALIVGNGTYKTAANIHTVDWNGNAKYAGSLYVNGTKAQDLADAKKVATEEYVNTKVAELVDNAPETLNTLKEVADALSENTSTAEALNQAIGNKVDKTAYPESANPHQYLTTDIEGNKVWENKLTYSAMEDVPFLEEKVWTGEETASFTATRLAKVGEKITLYVDDIPYTGILEDFYNMGWTIRFDEEYPELSEAIKTARISPPQMSFNTDTPWGIVGKISATITTDVIHPIDNKYLAFSISQGSNYPESISINGQASNSSGIKTVSINGGKATGMHSIAFHETSKADGYNAFAAAGGNAEGNHSAAFGFEAHSIGDYSMAIGTHNIADEKYLFVVGNGKSDKAKANAHTLDTSGNARFAGDLYVNGTNTEDLADAKKVATEEYVDNTVPLKIGFTYQDEQLVLASDAPAYAAAISNGRNAIATLEITRPAATEGELQEIEYCYAAFMTIYENSTTQENPYILFGFNTSKNETIKFKWNSDNTISDMSITKNLTEADINALIEAKIAPAE